MKIEIWSDVACPFCYIGKRHFEEALAQFDAKGSIELEWKSFQLDPDVPEIAAESQEDYLVKRKGMGVEQVREMLAHVTQMAQQSGLDFHLDKTVLVNTQKAHQLIQFAKTKNLGDEMEERLFKAYFTEGINLADLAELTKLGVEIGLDAEELQEAFTDDKYVYAMKQDIQEGASLGVRGVPFFVFNRKYGISGAQPVEAFTDTLNKSFAEWRELNPVLKMEVSNGQSCSTDGTCE